MGAWDEGMSKAVHGEERSCGGCITEIIDKGSSGHGGAGGRLCRNDGDIGAVDFVQDKGEGKTSKVTSPTYACCHDIDFLLSKFLQLFLGLETDDRLMHQHMVQDASQGVPGVLGGDSIFNGFADGNPEASWRIRVFAPKSFFLHSCLCSGWEHSLLPRCSSSDGDKVFDHN